MIQWNDLKSVCCGVTNMSFPLSDQPVCGEWLIFVEVQGHIYNKSFEVQKYMLPKYELLIEAPKYIQDINSCETGKVHARYTFGKPVAGMLTINMTVNGVGYYKQEAGHQVIKSMELYGSASFEICVKDMIPVDVPAHFRGALFIWASLASSDGSKQLAYDDSTLVQKQLIDIKYASNTRRQFKPGLPYKGKVEVTYPDGSPADGITVQIKAELTPKDNIYTTELVSKNGLVAFEIPSIPSLAHYVWLETQVTAINGKSTGEQYLPNYLLISSWYSPSKCHIQLEGPDKLLQVEKPKIPLIFGIPKTHKNEIDPPLRPIVSADGSKTHTLAKFVDNKTKKLWVERQQILKDSWDLLKVITDIVDIDNIIFVTIDVMDLFSSIPYKEGIEFYEEIIYEDNSLTNNDKQASVWLMDMVLQNNFLFFNGEFYKQSQGVAMECSVPPLLLICWDLNFVLEKLTLFPFEAAYQADFRFLTWQTVTVLAEVRTMSISEFPSFFGGSEILNCSSVSGAVGSAHTFGAEVPTNSSREVEICETYICFTITYKMTPLNRLLAYYVMENGEGVTDSIQIPVQVTFENQISVSMSSNQTLPGDLVDIKVKGEKGSCACIATVDKSVYFLRPGFQLTTDKIFQELAEYDVSDTFGIQKDDGHFWWPGLSSRRRRRRSVFPWHWRITKDASFAFTVTGLVVMTDTVNLNQRQDGGMYTDDTIPAFQPHTATQMVALQSQITPRAVKRKRTYFPETWIWHCFNISNVTGEKHLKVEVPHSITTWVTEAIGLCETKGLGLAKPMEIRTFKPFFVDFTLPYNVIRGEQTKILLTVYNYLPTCAEVHLKVSVPKGIKFVGHPGKYHMTRKMCISSMDAKCNSVVLTFSELGLGNITAKTFAYTSKECCHAEIQLQKSGKYYLDENYIDKRTPIGSDYIKRSILVEPEGLPRDYTYSFYFCPNERIHISTPNKYEYQYVQKPAKMTHFHVAVKAHNDAHFALSPSPYDTLEVIEIVIGGRQNSETRISASKMGEPVVAANTANILSWDEFRNFWISWKNGVVQVGHGTAPSIVSIIVQTAKIKPFDVKYIGFSTGWGSVGEFKIWRKEEADENHNKAFTLGVPHNIVPGSERATASLIGDVMGPTLNNLDKLVRLPFGCGEQNMIHFAPNVFVLKYLQKTKQLSPEVENEATDYLLQGYQRQLTYKRQDGSYSAFGERDSSGSMWLTAFVLKSFAQSGSFIFIDPKELMSAKEWIIQHQKEDGSFPAVGRILNKDIQGGIHGRIALTAYVVAALFEAGITSEEEKVSVGKAKQFLETNMHSAEDPYTTALIAYALTLLHSTSAPSALRKLNNMALTQDGFTHWSLTETNVADEDIFIGFSDGLSQSVVSAEVEMTAYALLTYTYLGDVAIALPVVKWLSQQRNALGGFSSTQDTCVALQALAEYAILSYVGGVNLTVSLASTNLDFQETFELNKYNKKILHKTIIPTIPTGLFVSAKGEGCCLMQIDVTYNVPDPITKPAFQLFVNLEEPKSLRYHQYYGRSSDFDHNHSQLKRSRRAVADDNDPHSDDYHQEYKVTLEACTRWLHSGSSNMAILEIPLLSGFRVDVESLEKVLMDKKIGLKRYEVDGRKVLFYFDEIPSECTTCIKFQSYREYIVGKTAPLPVKVYDYYEPAFEAIRFYNVSEDSPLARELCDGPSCNEVKSSISQWVGFVQKGPCNNVLGCIEEEHLEHCTCYRDCGYDGDPVCGSDGIIYQNQCHMETTACRNNTTTEQVPMSQCHLEATQSLAKNQKGSEALKIPAVSAEPEATQSLDKNQKGSEALKIPAASAEPVEEPTLQSGISYYSYDYEVESYATETDAFEGTEEQE
ncbi:C3 and PZP-like alpha-2-macroglobulin domain-containing protein 8 [Protopterus annectens]|uniref:C3 and PZP-like alpha-2-macroglobulin domain-containing protein 8 n=1 Tax=Protopterus annectens TaxID=7888 RepID=UPI001CFB39E3|nr:C3 and PZP-like alpha-2-macroglobulin domain-containing protein 8 [Protopterus annectens]